jgi:hypothetical protein
MLSIIFDLDETLLNTSMLRGGAGRGEIRRAGVVDRESRPKLGLLWLARRLRPI